MKDDLKVILVLCMTVAFIVASIAISYNVRKIYTAGIECPKE